MTRILFIVNLLAVSCSLRAQDTLSLFDYLHRQGTEITFILDTDNRQLTKRKLEKEYQPLVLTIQSGDSTWMFPGKVRTRGNFRLQVCDNPSLKIKLDKRPLVAAGFSDLNEFKLVQQCSNGRVGLGYVRREQLAYHLHAIYSPHSHRTIPLHLRQRPDDPEDEFSKGFIVEEEEQLAARYGGQINESDHASTSGLDRASYVNMCLFNYLILNTDWNVFNLHNVEVLSRPGQKRLIAIPYDFDYSGFVGTTYATPHESVGISSVQIPKWVGRKVSFEEIKEAAGHFLSKAEAARSLVENYPELSDYSRKRLLHRLEGFNEEIADDKRLKKLIRR